MPAAGNDLRMAKHTQNRNYDSSVMVTGTIYFLAIVFRIQDRKNHKMKESNRPSAKE